MRLRNTKVEEEEKGEYVIVTVNFFNALRDTNFISSIQKLELIYTYREGW